MAHRPRTGPRIVVVGAGAAASGALGELARLQFSGHVTVIGDEPHLPYNRTTVNKGLLGGTATVDEIELPRAAVPTSWRSGSRAVALDADRREVLLAGGERLGYDALLIATGAVPRHLSVDAGRVVLTLRTVDDALALTRALGPRPRAVAVIGGGLIGNETASVLAASGHNVTLVDRNARPLERQLGPLVADWVAGAHLTAGVTAVSGRVVRRAAKRGNKTELVLDDGSALVVDVAIAAVGARPEVEWLADSGLDVGDGVRADAALRACRAAPPRRDGTSPAEAAPEIVPHVAVAGDAALWPHQIFTGKLLRVEHWGNALAQGAHAIRTLLADLQLAGSPAPFLDLPAYSTYVHGKKVHVVGLPHRGTRLSVVRGEPGSDRFAVAHTDEHGVVVGVVAVGGAKPVTALRPVIEARGRLEDAAVPV